MFPRFCTSVHADWDFNTDRGIPPHLLYGIIVYIIVCKLYTESMGQGGYLPGTGCAQSSFNFLGNSIDRENEKPVMEQ